MWLLLFAQNSVPISPVPGIEGWAGAGLLGAVLAWLMFVYLPAQAKLLRDMLADKDAQIKALIESSDLAIGELHKQCGQERREQFQYFNESLNRILERHSKDLEPLQEGMESLRAAINSLGTAVDALRHSSGKAQRGEHNQPTRS